MSFFLLLVVVLWNWRRSLNSWGWCLKETGGDSDLEERNDQESHLEIENEIEDEIEFLQEQLEQTETQFRRYSDFDLKKYEYLEK